MQHLEFEADLPIAIQDAFNLVSDVRGYTDFLPMLNRVDVFDEHDAYFRARFTFNLDGALGKLARRFNVTDGEAVSLIGWDMDREIRAQGEKSPLKAIFMNCRLTLLAPVVTRANIYIGFETGYAWPADSLAALYVKHQANGIIKTIGPRVVDIVTRRKLFLEPLPE